MANEGPYFYVYTLAALSIALCGIRPSADAKRPHSKEHLAWLLQQATMFRRASKSDALKASGHAVLMLSIAESLGFWDRQTSVMLLQKDLELGFQKPKLDMYV